MAKRQQPSTRVSHTPPTCSRLEIGVQPYACSDEFWERNKLRLPSFCIGCLSDRVEDECRFEGFRILKHTSQGVVEEDGFFKGNQEPESFPYHNHDVSRCTTADIASIRHKVACALLPMLKKEASVVDSSDFFWKYSEFDQLVSCDSCGLYILFSTYFCRHCGQELCTDCLPRAGNESELPANCPHAFIPVCRKPKEELSSILRTIQETCSASESPSPPKTSSSVSLKMAAWNEYNTVPELDSSDETAFRYLFSRRIPMLINVSMIVGNWSPAYWRTRHGHMEVTVDIVPQRGAARTKEMRLEEFLNMFENTERKDAVKLSNFPNDADFYTALPDEWQPFLETIPFSDITGPRAVWNLASHYPLGIQGHRSFRPDFGPKVYFSTPNLTRDSAKKGSTRLHSDVSDALNICVYGDQGASWVVIHHEDRAKLRSCLENMFRHGGNVDIRYDGDLLHEQRVFLEKHHIQTLRDAGVRVYEFLQAVGQAVCVPAGWPHQVDNRGSCIKLATDWVHVDSIGLCQELLPEMMEQLHVDKIQIPQLLWHAWHSLSEMYLQSTTRDSQKEQLIRSIRRKNPATISMKNKKKPGKTDGTLYCPHVNCQQVVKHRKVFDRNGLICHLENGHGILFDDRKRLLRDEIQDSDWEERIRTGIVAAELRKSERGG